MPQIMTGPRNLLDLQAGHYLVRLAPHAWRAPARLWQEDGEWRGSVLNKPADPYQLWPWLRWTITEAEYEHRILLHHWCLRHEPWRPEANPYRSGME